MEDHWRKRTRRKDSRCAKGVGNRLEGLYARRLLSPRSLNFVSPANLDAGSILYSNSISHNGLVSLFLFSRLGAIVDLMVEVVSGWRWLEGGMRVARGRNCLHQCISYDVFRQFLICFGVDELVSLLCVYAIGTVSGYQKLRVNLFRCWCL